MNREHIPIVRHMGDIGPEDPVFDSMLLLGPVVVAAVGVLGRTPVSTALVAGYLVAFAVYTAYRATEYETEIPT